MFRNNGKQCSLGRRGVARQDWIAAECQYKQIGKLRDHTLSTTNTMVCNPGTFFIISNTRALKNKVVYSGWSGSRHLDWEKKKKLLLNWYLYISTVQTYSCYNSAKSGHLSQNLIQHALTHINHNFYHLSTHTFTTSHTQLYTSHQINYHMFHSVQYAW